MNKGGVVFVIFLLVLAVVGYWAWQLKREFNYSWAYESKVEGTAEETICRMVKPEYLKDPSDC